MKLILLKSELKEILINHFTDIISRADMADKVNVGELIVEHTIGWDVVPITHLHITIPDKV